MSHFEQFPEIPFEVFGDDLQYVELKLKAGESILVNGGSYLMSEEGLVFKAIFNHGNEESSGGFLNKLKRAGKNLFSGEDLYHLYIENKSLSEKKLYLSPLCPGKVLAIDLKDYNGTFICYKDAFLAIPKASQLKLNQENKSRNRFLSGSEPFLNIESTSTLLLQSFGTVIKRELISQEKLMVDMKSIMGFESSVELDFEEIKGWKTSTYAEEGGYLAILKGPGDVYLQSLSFKRFSLAVCQYAPRPSSSSNSNSSHKHT